MNSKTNGNTALPFSSNVGPTLRKTGKPVTASVDPSDALAEMKRQLEEMNAKLAASEQARVAAESKASTLAKAKGTTHETFDPMTVPVKVKEETGTVVINMGGGFGMYGVIAAYPDGMLRLGKLLANDKARERILAWIEANRSKLLDMHAKYEARKPEIQARAAERRAAAKAEK
jgi:hypothetical protein